MIPLGLKPRAFLEGLLRADLDDYVRDPREAVAEHHARRGAARKSMATPAERSRRQANPEAGHARYHGRASFLYAVTRACDRAFPHPTLARIAGNGLTEEQGASCRQQGRGVLVTVSPGSGSQFIGQQNSLTTKCPSKYQAASGAV